MSSTETQATPCGSGIGSLKKRAAPGDTSPAGELDVPALVDAHFISIVRGYEELYICDHPLYGDSQRTRAVWEEIGTIVNQPADDCRKRWARIRENYFQSMKRAKRLSNEPEFQARRLSADKLLSFLNPTFETSTTGFHFVEETPESDNDDSSDSSDGDNRLSKEKHSSDFNDCSSNDVVEGPTTHVLNAAPPSAHQQFTQDDTVDFFVQLGETVKDFPEGVRIHIKRKAFKIVTDAEEMLYNQKVGLDVNMYREHE